MPSTDGLVAHDVSGVSSANSQVAQAYVTPPSAPKLPSGADAFSAAMAALDVAFEPQDAALLAGMNRATVTFVGKNNVSSGILLGADGENAGQMDSVVEV